MLDADGARALADVEPREVLLARLAGAMAAPMVQFAGLLQALPRNLAYGLKALIDQKGGVPEAPAAEPTRAERRRGARAPRTAAEPPRRPTRPPRPTRPADETAEPRPTRPRPRRRPKPEES